MGISVGHPDVSYSFCGKWHWVSKLLLCAVMLRGRHRGLPVEIDMAIMLPSEEGLKRMVATGGEGEMEGGVDRCGGSWEYGAGVTVGLV